jgi:hypothetical protein
MVIVVVSLAGVALTDFSFKLSEEAETEDKEEGLLRWLPWVRAWISI